MIIDVYDFDDYRDLFKEAIKYKAQQGRGQRSALATFLKCQPTYVSHVLAGRADFSLEQAEAACRYFGFSGAQQHFVMLLVTWHRSGTKELKQYYRTQIDETLAEGKEIKNVIGNKNHLSEKDRVEYYRTWRHGAVHMLLTIPGYDETSKIAKQLRISEAQVQNTIEFLRSIGIIETGEGKLKVLHETLHLDRQAPEIHSLHTQHRLKALDSLAEPQETDLHFSTFFSCAEDDLPKVKSLFLKAIESIASVLKKSSADCIGGISIDFYKI